MIGLIDSGMDVAALVGDHRAPAEAAETFAWLSGGGGRIKTVFEFD